MGHSRFGRSIKTVVILGGTLAAASSSAERPCCEPADRVRPATPVERESATIAGPDQPSQLERDFAPPDPDRPWGPRRYLDPYRHRSFAYRDEPYGGRRWYDVHDYPHRFGPRRYGDFYGYDLERAYRQGVSDGRHFERFEIQAERGLANYQDAMARGHAAFAAGEYAQAYRDFLLAATLNQGDPSSRLCAAHAQIAVGNYEPAARLLRRAFELQPKIVYLPMDIRTAYGNPEDFRRHRQALERAAENVRHDGDFWFVLGYVCFFSDEPARAARALARAARLTPDDPVVARFAELARREATSPE